MQKKVSLGVMVALILLAVALTISATMVFAMRHFNSLVSDIGQRKAIYAYLDEIDLAARRDYTIDEEKLRAALANGYIDGLGDPYADYLPSTEYQKVQESLKGNRTGFGLTFTVKDNDLIVASVDAQSPAALAGVTKGDIVTAIDGETVNGASYTIAAATVNSAEKVLLTVKHAGETTAVELTANTYVLQSVAGRMLNNGIGYITIREFNALTASQFKKAYNDLTEKGAVYFVFDVRNNAGGDMEAVQEILDYLLPRGPYLNCDKKGTKVPISAVDAYEMTAPSVTLINGNTIGEAEAFAAVLQDMKKSELVGTSTQGKAVLQEYVGIQSDKGAVLLSVGTLYRINSGDTWAESGLMPDKTVDLPYNEQLYFSLLTDDKDTQLQAAIALLRTK